MWLTRLIQTHGKISATKKITRSNSCNRIQQLVFVLSLLVASSGSTESSHTPKWRMQLATHSFILIAVATGQLTKVAIDRSDGQLQLLECALLDVKIAKLSIACKTLGVYDVAQSNHKVRYCEISIKERQVGKLFQNTKSMTRDHQSSNIKAKRIFVTN